VTSSFQRCPTAKSIVQRRPETKEKALEGGITTEIRRKFLSLMRSRQPSCNLIRWRDAALRRSRRPLCNQIRWRDAVRRGRRNIPGSDASFETLPPPLHVEEVAHTKKEPCPYTTPSTRLASDSRRAQIYQLSLSFPS